MRILHIRKTRKTLHTSHSKTALLYSTLTISPWEAKKHGQKAAIGVLLAAFLFHDQCSDISRCLRRDRQRPKV
jgi:hypothetical protein